MHPLQSKTENKYLYSNFSGFGTRKQMAGLLGYGTVFWVVVMVVANIVNFENSKLEPSFRTTICQPGYKQCLSAADDFKLCSHILHNCTSSGNFTQPKPKELISKKPVNATLFNAAENLINLRRCEKKKFYDTKICNNT